MGSKHSFATIRYTKPGGEQYEIAYSDLGLPYGCIPFRSDKINYAYIDDAYDQHSLRKIARAISSLNYKRGYYGYVLDRDNRLIRIMVGDERVAFHLLDFETKTLICAISMSIEHGLRVLARAGLKRPIRQPTEGY